ncbi:MAG TPA: DUF1861 family protein [Clostridiaceae bacterium]|jgi:hypothetical protein|nr:DUF1861 family protein [Clostridiaceae bacterium]
MVLEKQKIQFEKTKKIFESTKLKFYGVDGWDVYNTSIPFEFEGDMYIYGRVEKRDEWAQSHARLFKKTGMDEWTWVPGSMMYPLEDPFISVINGTYVLGGTHVRYRKNAIDTFYAYFYSSNNPYNLRYFTTGPEYMKDIRLVQLPNNRIGVFSRHRKNEVTKKHGKEALVGFTIIDNLYELDEFVINTAPIIHNLFNDGEWGGFNQCYYLSSGHIGIIGHKSYETLNEEGNSLYVYVNMSFVFDYIYGKILDEKIIATRSCYPAGPAKKPYLVDCAFASGIVMRPDGKADLYSGIGDTEEGRVVIDYPFEGYGEIVNI